MKITPYIITENTGQACNQNDDTVDERGLFTANTKHIHAEGHDVFKYCYDRREACKGHKQEEKSSPDASALHMNENIGKGNENQLGTCIDFDTIAEAGRKYNQSGSNCDKGIQRADPDAFSCKGMLPAHIASKDFHCSNTEA